MTDPGGAQERKSEEIRREHMRIAKDCVLPVQGKREKAHGATSWTMSFAMLCHALPPCTTQRTVTSVTMSHVSKFQNSFQLHLLPISAQEINPRLWSILDPNQTLTWKSYVKWELKYIHIYICILKIHTQKISVYIYILYDIIRISLSQYGSIS